MPMCLHRKGITCPTSPLYLVQACVQILSTNTRRTKVVELTSGTHRYALYITLHAYVMHRLHLL